jgi:hypothetical protein
MATKDNPGGKTISTAKAAKGAKERQELAAAPLRKPCQKPTAEDAEDAEGRREGFDLI